MPAYSFVVPIYNDGYLVRAFCDEMEKQMRLLLGDQDLAEHLEIIFVNDGSRDDSQALLRDAARRLPFVRVIELSRNFGQHVAISCGYRFAQGDYIASMNVDMQDPPDQIGALVRKIREGECDIVVGLRDNRQDSWVQTLTSRGFNVFLNFLTGAKTPTNSASIRIMTRAFVNAYNRLSEKTPFIPGLENWLGFRHAYVLIRHQRRTSGKSSYTFRKRLRLATEAIIGFSDLPLRLAAALGCGVTFVGVLLIAGLAVQRLFSTNMFPGYTSTVSLIVLLGGANLMFLGLLGLYVGRILREVQDRPRYVITSLENFPGEENLSDSSRAGHF